MKYNFIDLFCGAGGLSYGFEKVGLNCLAGVDQFKNAKIKRAKELHNQGYQKTEILRMIINEFKLDRDINSRSWPRWLSEIQ